MASNIEYMACTADFGLVRRFPRDRAIDKDLERRLHSCLLMFESKSKEEQIKEIGLLFEPCPVLCELIMGGRVLAESASYTELIERTREELLRLAQNFEDERIPAIIAAHPRLGARKVDSAQSRAEQASLAGEAEKLAALNSRYEATFPGLRYVVFVNGRPREEIMADMEARIARGDRGAEVVAAFGAMCDIALDRARKLGFS